MSTIEAILTRLEATLKERDVRLTPQREAVLKSLAERTQDHLTVEEIHRAARRYHPGISLATVYRTMDLLVRAGLARPLDSGDTFTRYEVKENQHPHLICLSCGRIIEVEEPIGWGEYIGKNDFVVTSASVRLFGYCDRCARQRFGVPSSS